MFRIIPRWLREYFPVKLGLFLLAIVLWFLVITERTYEYSFATPITPVNVKPGRMIAEPYPGFGLVRYHGSGKHLLRIRFLSTPTIEVNLSTINNYYDFPLRPDMVRLPAGVGVDVTEILRPDTVRFVLDQQMNLELPVLPQVYVKPAAGYTLAGDLVLSPETVNLTGPYKKISEIDLIYTDSVSIIDVRRTTELMLTLLPPDFFGVSLSTDHVKCVVPIERLGERLITGVPVRVLNPPAGRDVLVEPGSVDISISGGVSVLSEAEKGSFNAFIDYRKLIVGKARRVPVEVEADSAIHVGKVTPPDVRVIVRRKSGGL